MDEICALDGITNRPLFIINKITREIRSIKDGPSFTSRERQGKETSSFFYITQFYFMLRKEGSIVIFFFYFYYSILLFLNEIHYDFIYYLSTYLVFVSTWFDSSSSYFIHCDKELYKATHENNIQIKASSNIILNIEKLI